MGGPKSHSVFNLIEAPEQFKIGAYEFTRHPDYDDRQRRVYQPTTIREQFDSGGGETKEVSEQVYGEHSNTYTATTADEPPSQLWPKGVQIHDVVLLLRLISGRCICLDYEREIWWHYGRADHMAPVALAPRIADQVLDKGGLLRFKDAEAHLASYYYFRSWQGTLMDFQIADLGIAWDVLSSGFDKREKDAEFSKRKKAFLKEVRPLLDGLGTQHGADLTRKANASIANISVYSLSDRILHMVSSLGVLPDVAPEKIREQAALFSAIRGCAVHDGRVPNELKSFDVPKRAIRYYAFTFRSLMTVVLGKLLGVDDSWMAQNVADVTSYFTKGEFRGEKPFTEEDSRLEAQIKQLVSGERG